MKKEKKTRNRIKKKPINFMCRMSEKTKEMLKDKSSKKDMNMSQYIEYLIQKDKPKNNN